MSIRVNREKLLQSLEAVQPGLTTRDVMEQSACFAFTEGVVATFNDEIACRKASPLKIEGAVPSGQLLSILRKLKEETLIVEVDAKEEQLIFRGKAGRRFGLSMQPEILLPIDKVEKPKKWIAVHEDFSDAVYLTHTCAGTDESQFTSTCLHIHPKWIEASDNEKMARFKIKCGIKEPVLIRASSIKHIVSLDMTEFCETETWIHFRNPSGLVFSCRRWIDDYEDLGPYLSVKGSPLTLPKGLVSAAENSAIFSSDNSENTDVIVELRPGKIRVRGQGAAAWYSEPKKSKYKGKPLKFHIAPSLLIELAKRYSECEITKKILKVDGGRFVYCASLGTLDKED